MKELPLAYRERMKDLLGEDFAAYEAALREDPVEAYRVNAAKISVADFEKLGAFGGEAIPYVPGGYYLTEKIGNHPYHHAGMVYVQEPGAMAPAECIDVDRDWWILDMCAAPGGKSTQLKNKLGEGGILVSNEIIPSRCKILTGNIERVRLRYSVTTCMDTARLAKIFPHTFDLIMVDAPCSGEGMFRKEEIAIDEWTPENVAMCADRQAEILENAARALREGGYIIYATCTFSLEENEMTLDAFLAAHPEFEIVPVKEAVREHTADGIAFAGCRCENIRYARRFYPHTGRGEGQFMAVLHHTGEAVPRIIKPAKAEKLDPAVTAFLDDTLLTYEKDHVRMYNGSPVYFTPDLPIEKGVAFACGVTIGELRKNYIQPHHQFFMAMGRDFRRKIELSADSETLARYLHGEEIETDADNGWAVVTVDGCAVGGAKVSGGRAKNHYPKGLRM